MPEPRLQEARKAGAGKIAAAVPPKSFAALPNAPGAGLADWAAGLATAAAASFTAHGLPTRRLEAWRYTDLAALTAARSEPGAAEPASTRADGSALPSAAGVTVTLQRGQPLQLAGKLPKGLRVLPLSEAINSGLPGLHDLLAGLDTSRPDQAMQALNTAALGAGLVVAIEAGVNAGTLQLEWLGDGTHELAQPRVCLLLGAGARLELAERFAPGLSANLVLQAQLAEGAVLNHARLQEDSATTLLVNSTEISLAGGAEYLLHGLDQGGRIVRHTHCVRFTGAGARCELRAAALPGESQHVDHRVTVEHAAPGCTSRQLFRGVASGNARLVLNSLVQVRPGADGSEARQSIANLLLSERAEVFAKPELEIETDEVVASHGATVGQLDETALFYLRSRGLTPAAARSLLTAAFCAMTLDGIVNAAIHGLFLERMNQVLEQRA